MDCALVVASGVLIAGGALSGHPAGFIAIGAGYGLIENAVVIFVAVGAGSAW